MKLLKETEQFNNETFLNVDNKGENVVRDDTVEEVKLREILENENDEKI